MRPTLESKLAMLSLALLAAFAFFGCESTGGGSASGTHNMGNAKKPHMMSDQDMPGR